MPRLNPVLGRWVCPGLLVFFFLFLAAGPAAAGDVSAGEVQLEGRALLGLWYNSQWDPAWSGLGLGLSYRSDFWQAGVEYAVTGLGSQINARAGLLWAHSLGPLTRALDGRLSAGPEFHAGAGLALFRPYPLPVWNLEALYRLELRVGRSRRTSLDLTGGISGSTCPAYRRLAAPYTVIDFPLSLSVSF